MPCVHRIDVGPLHILPPKSPLQADADTVPRLTMSLLWYNEVYDLAIRSMDRWMHEKLCTSDQLHPSGLHQCLMKRFVIIWQADLCCGKPTLYPD